MKIVKKCMALFLAVLMLSGCLSTGFAVFAEEKLPQIYVNGIGSRKVYDKTDPDQISLFYPVDSEGMLENLKKFPEYAKQAVEELNPDLLYSCVYSWMWDTMGKAALGKDGMTSADENVIIDPCGLDYAGNGKYYFNYDSRLDPVDLAKQLDEYIGLVQGHSGKQRIELVGSSYGTSVIMAYLNEYPEKLNIIDSVVLCVPCFEGVEFVGEIFSGQLTVDAQTLDDFVQVMLGNEDVDLVLDILYKCGALDIITDIVLEPVLYAALMRAVRDLARDLFGTFPSMWSFVEDEFFRDALVNLYGENYEDENHEYAALIKKITYYHDNVMVRGDEIFDNARENGIKMNIIAKYGRPSLPLSKYGNFMSDGLVSVENSSMGATCAPYRETLPENYVQSAYGEYNMISADRCIDASTGIAPLNTWYIRGLEHAEKPQVYYQLIDAVIYNDLDVNTDAKYPQFMEYDGENLIPLRAIEKEKETTVLEDLIRLLLRVIDIFMEKLRALTGKAE